jgi:hypothetical protein
MKKGSPWTKLVSDAILQLNDNGQLQELYLKWWKKTLDCDLYEDKSQNSHSLSFNGVAGVFFVVLCGICLACLITFFENIWNKF